ncbi:fasciclin domain-containing protein [Pontibacter sp. E15-1]|uniref:fasciclin domain-containing protein n=1 Tax=Pontibacter sp. E15-1 TaxID=2919918 RepID=UPI001F4FBF1B|nr:fasciclin domain-containing protein [Pontibacter sp. E15-1]MCJ8165850.1 fasciclin domain-containing protein [Pontibacter sp. E15-1]
MRIYTWGALAFAVSVSYGCASSDTTVNYEGMATESPITDENEITSYTPPDTAGSMDRDAYVSAENELGSNQNIIALVQQNPDLSTFLDLLRAADLVVTLESPASYTVFAPSNKAFAALPEGTLAALKAPSNKMELTRILQAHILPIRLYTASLQQHPAVTTAQGDALKVTHSDSGLMVGGAHVLTPDVKAANGVVHVIDKVLVPPSADNR